MRRRRESRCCGGDFGMLRFLEDENDSKGCVFVCFKSGERERERKAHQYYGTTAVSDWLCSHVVSKQLPGLMVKTLY